MRDVKSVASLIGRNAAEISELVESGDVSDIWVYLLRSENNDNHVVNAFVIVNAQYQGKKQPLLLHRQKTGKSDFVPHTSATLTAAYNMISRIVGEHNATTLPIYIGLNADLKKNGFTLDGLLGERFGEC